MQLEADLAMEDKKKIKCKYFPKCRDSDEACPYYHPQEKCQYFPNCQYGEKCLYIHPDVSSLIEL